MTKPTKWPVRPAKTQISLGFCPVWSESLLWAHWIAQDPSFLHADSKDSDQTRWIPRLIWVFAEGTCHFVGFVMRWLIWAASSKFGTYRLCEQRRFRRDCASAQSRQNFRCSLIQAVSQEEPSDRKPDPWPLWMAGYAHLEFVMRECSKTQIRLMRHISSFSFLWLANVMIATTTDEPRHEKTCLQEFPTRPDTNRPAQPQKLARTLKFRL